MKLNYKPIKEQVWESVYSSVRRSASIYPFNIFLRVRYVLYDSINLSILSPIKNSINQTLEQHNERNVLKVP